MRSLLAITDRANMGSAPLERIGALMSALRERVIVQVREKDLGGRELYEWTAVLSLRAAQTGARLFINGRADVVRCFAPAVGLHLAEDGLSVKDARAFLPAGTQIGRSIHAVAGAGEEADLYAIAPVYPTPSKPGAPTLGLEGLRAIVAAIGGRGESYALGGIDRENVDAVFDTGVTGVAAIRGAWSGALAAWCADADSAR